MEICNLSNSLCKELSAINNEKITYPEKAKKIYEHSISAIENIEKTARTAKQRIEVSLIHLHLAKVSLAQIKLKMRMRGKDIIDYIVYEGYIDGSIFCLNMDEEEEKDRKILASSRKRKSIQITESTQDSTECLMYECYTKFARIYYSVEELNLKIQVPPRKRNPIQITDSEQEIIDKVFSDFVLDVKSYIKLLNDLCDSSPESFVTSEDLERYSNWVEKKKKIDRVADLEFLGAMCNCENGTVVGEYEFVSLSRYEEYVSSKSAQAFANLPASKRDFDYTIIVPVRAGLTQFSALLDVLLSQLNTECDNKIEKSYKSKVANQEANHRKLAKLSLFSSIHKKQLIPVPTKCIPKKISPMLPQASLPCAVPSKDSLAQRGKCASEPKGSHGSSSSGSALY